MAQGVYNASKASLDSEDRYRYMPRLDLSPNLKIHYIDINKSGSPVVLLLHGLGATGESWGLQVPALLAAGFRILVPDLRGFGKSSYPGGALSISSMATDLVYLLDNLQVSVVDAVGISMGGTVGLQFALDYPERVRKLVLVNTFAQLKPERWDVWFYFFFRIVLIYTLGMAMQARAVARRIFPEPKQAELRQILINQITEADPRSYRAAIWALARFNVTQRLSELTIPTLVITGECDSTVPPRAQKQLAELIPNAQHITIPGARHAVIADQPEIFNKILLDSLID